MNVPEGSRAEWCAVPSPVVGEELAFEAGHIDANGALGFAGAALEAEIEHAVGTFVAEPGLAEAAGHGETEHVGATARRIFFVSRRHVRGTHGAGEFFAAGAHAAAHF